jgi:hypothetical protein
VSIEELKALRRFPKGQEEIEASDRAKIVLSKKQIKVTNKGRRLYKYKGIVTFTYCNGKDYDFIYEGRSLKKVLRSSMTTFEQRNKQMLSYEGS